MKKILVILFMLISCIGIFAQQNINDTTAVNYDNVPRSTDKGAYDDTPYMMFAVQPEIPAGSEKFEGEFKVFVNVLLGSDGLVKKTSILKSDNDFFNNSAITAAINSKYSPAKKDGKPIALWIVLPYRFSLPKKS